MTTYQPELKPLQNKTPGGRGEQEKSISFHWNQVWEFHDHEFENITCLDSDPPR